MASTWLTVACALVVHAFASTTAPERPPTSDQSRVTRLTSLGARSGQPFPSPDGRRIAFVSNHEAGWQLWLLDEDGAEPHRLTSEADPVGWPSWSRDGGAIHFYGRRDGGYRLLRLDLQTGTVARMDTLGWEAFRPVLHPAGELLLFDAVDPSTGGDHDIYVRHIATGRVRRLTDERSYDSDARWSPDGRRIAFHSDRGAPALETQVYVMSSDGTDVRALTRGPALNGYPTWSPNGRCIVHTAEFDGNREVQLIGSEGGHAVRLTRHAGFDGDPVWDPRGGRIVFATDRFGGVELAALEVSDALAGRCERARGDG